MFLDAAISLSGMHRWGTHQEQRLQNVSAIKIPLAMLGWHSVLFWRVHTQECVVL